MLDDQLLTIQKLKIQKQNTLRGILFYLTGYGINDWDVNIKI